MQGNSPWNRFLALRKLGPTRRDYGPSSLTVGHCKALGTRLFRAEENGGRTCVDLWSSLSPHFDVTTSSKVPSRNIDVHWFQRVEFMTWVKAGRRAQVEEMNRQPEATRIRESVHRWDVETCSIHPIQTRAGATNWISRWVDAYKLSRIWVYGRFANQFPNVFGRAVNMCYSSSPTSDQRWSCINFWSF